MISPALELHALNKSFGPLPVTREVSLRLERGARHALIGPNGAGKTTLVNLITGQLRPSSGTIRLAGLDITGATRERRVALGLARTFQINSLFQSLTVAETVALAVAARTGIDARPWGRLAADPAVGEETEALLESLRIAEHRASPVASLAYGQRRLVEVALALALKPTVLLLDEPAAGLSAADGALILDLLLRLPDEVAVLVVEHDMGLVFRFAQRITVLVRGGVLIEGTVEEVRADKAVQDVYLGRRHHG
jgi:branched-chain amino acid transport system ATP-binding protein